MRPVGGLPTGDATRRRLLLSALVALLTGLPMMGAAETLLHGEVVQVSDAVSFVARVEGGRRVRVRVLGVAAPAGREADLARRALARLVFGRQVTLRAEDAGASPLPAEVSAGGTDVAATLVANGLLRADGSRPALRVHEDAARRLGLGIWDGSR